MRSVIFITATLWIAVTADGRGGTISGRVTEAEADSALIHATILLSGTDRGTVTDADGRFSLDQIPPGRYSILVRHIGYLEETISDIEVTELGGSFHRIVLTPSPVPVGGVEVTGVRGLSDSYERASVLNIQPERSKTLAGVGEDVFRTLQALPGVLAPNDFSSQLIVRGSGPDENLIVFDDIEIYNPYRLYGMISIFNPDAVSSITLTSGGFPARYGNRLSAVLRVESREGDRSRPIGGSINASITNANIVLHGGDNPLGLSYSLSARRTYYDLILGPLAKRSGLVKGDVAFPNFTDFQSRLVYDAARNHSFSFTALAGKDGVNLISGEDRENPDSISIQDDTRNEALGLGWSFTPSPAVATRLTLSYYRNRGDADFQGSFLDPSLNRELFEGNDTVGARLFDASFTSRYSISKYSAAKRIVWSQSSHFVEFGLGVDHISSTFAWTFEPDETFRAILQSRSVTFPDEIRQQTSYNNYFAYLEDDVSFPGGISVTPGLRYDFFGFMKSGVFQPRLRLTVPVSATVRLDASWGIYYQAPGYERLRDQSQFYDFTDPSAKNLLAEKAVHYILGLEHWVTHTWQVRVESYFKRFDDLLNQSIYYGTHYESALVDGSDPKKLESWETPRLVSGDSLTSIPSNAGFGESYGVEFLLQKVNSEEGDRLSGWISYTIARANRTENGVLHPFPFDQRHTVNLVLDFRVNGWLDLGIRWRYGSNFTHTPPLGIKPRIIEVTTGDVARGVIQTDQSGSVVFDLDRGGPENRWSARLPPYHRLDVRLSARADYWDLDWQFYLDVINVYNRENVLAYQFYVNDDLTIGRNVVGMLPILPTIGVSVRF